MDEDARELIANFPDNSVERFFILFPDPWPKRSHNKRRLINTEFLNLLAKKNTYNRGNIHCNRSSGLCRVDSITYKAV
jgi:tRNA G46 methylase TrmB